MHIYGNVAEMRVNEGNAWIPHNGFHSVCIVACHFVPFRSVTLAKATVTTVEYNDTELQR